MPDPLLSVVIPVRNGARSLPALLAALSSQTVGRDGFEVVVVDNGSRDGSGHIARSAGASVVSEPRRGRALARNRGVAAASASLIAFTDADCVPAPGWLEALLGCLRRSPIVAGAVELSTGKPPNRWERLELLWRFAQRHSVEQGWGATANLGVRRQAFSDVGGFDPSFRLIGEDVDFCLRAGAAGHAIGFCEEARVAHRAEASLSAIVRRAFVHGYSSNQHAHRWPGKVGWQYWRHPRPMVAGDWALRRFGALAVQQRDLLAPARLEYTGEVFGSLWAELRRAR